MVYCSGKKCRKDEKYNKSTKKCVKKKKSVRFLDNIDEFEFDEDEFDMPMYFDVGPVSPPQPVEENTTIGQDVGEKLKQETLLEEARQIKQREEQAQQVLLEEQARQKAEEQVREEEARQKALQKAEEQTREEEALQQALQKAEEQAREEEARQKAEEQAREEEALQQTRQKVEEQAREEEALQQALQKAEEQAREEARIRMEDEESRREQSRKDQIRRIREEEIRQEKKRQDDIREEEARVNRDRIEQIRIKTEENNRRKEEAEQSLIEELHKEEIRLEELRLEEIRKQKIRLEEAEQARLRQEQEEESRKRHKPLPLCMFNQSENSYVITSPECPLSMYSTKFPFIVNGTFTFHSVEHFVQTAKALFYEKESMRRNKTLPQRLLSTRLRERTPTSVQRDGFKLYEKGFRTLLSNFDEAFHKKWEKRRQDMIMLGNLERFEKYERLVENLRSTGDTNIRYEKQGTDLMSGTGKILMKIRELINSGFEIEDQLKKAYS